MTPTSYHPAAAQPAALLLLLILLASLPGPERTWAQSAQGDPADLTFKVVNATTGQPGSLDRLELQYSSHVLNPVLDIVPEGSEFTVPAVPVKEIGLYIITAWKDGVPYFWSLRGQKMLDGPVTLHVFDTSGDLDQVRLSGLNLLLRKGQSLVDLEYMLQVDNAARPQVTVVGSPVLELAVPDGADGFAAHYTRGPQPIAVDVSKTGTNRVGLTLPLTTGQNQIRLTFSAPWSEGMTVPVGASVPVDAWSLLATPENLDIQAGELEPDDSLDLPGHRRFIGPALEADRDFPIQVRGRVASGPAEDVFASEAPADAAAAPTGPEEEKGGSSFPWPAGLAILTVLIVLAALRRRRS